MRQRMNVIMCLAALAVAPAAAAYDLNLAVGADFSGDFDAGNISVSADTGYTLGLELAFKIPVIEAGVGLEYGFSRGAQDFDIDASYYQLYGIGRFYIGPAYIAGRYGYSDVSFSEAFDGSSNGGSWGFGGGVELLGKLKVELLFSSLGSDLNYEGWSLRLLYTF
jgi:hypothetical protein